MTPEPETVAEDLAANPEVDLDEHDIEHETALPRLPRSGDHRTRPLPVALSDDAFAPDVDQGVDPTTPCGSWEPAGAPAASEEPGSPAVAGRRRRTVAPSTPAEPQAAEPEFPEPGPASSEPDAGSEPSWRSILAQRPEPARPELPSPDSPEHDATQRDAIGPATVEAADDADLPQGLRPRGLRRAEDTDENGSQAVTDIRRQPARPPARPRADLRGPVAPAQRAGRRNADPREMGMPAFVAVLVGVGGSVVGAFLDILVTGGVGLLFSLCFVLTAFGVAAGVRRTGMFTAGVLPPFAALASLVVVAAVDPQRIATTTSPVRAVLVGLAWESWTIVAGCAVALVTIAVRAAFAHRARVSGSRRPA